MCCCCYWAMTDVLNDSCGCEALRVHRVSGCWLLALVVDMLPNIVFSSDRVRKIVVYELAGWMEKVVETRLRCVAMPG